MPSLPGDGTREAARRWLIHLRIADVSRVRTLFTHHPRYADLTPVQYAEGLEWLRRTDLVSPSGRPAVNVGEGLSLSGTAVPHVLWNAEDDERRRATGTAGRAACLRFFAEQGWRQWSTFQRCQTASGTTSPQRRRSTNTFTLK